MAQEPGRTKSEHELAVAQLRERLARSRDSRKKALAGLKACAERATAQTPPGGTPIIPPAAAPAPAPAAASMELGPEDSGVRQLPGEEQVRLRKAQLEESGKKRRSRLAALKRTTAQAVQTAGDTTLFNLGLVRDQLAGESGHGPAPA